MTIRVDIYYAQVLQVSVTSLLTPDHRGTRETSKILMEYGSECP